MSASNDKQTIFCGTVFNPILPDQLQPYEKPIVLGEVVVEVANKINPCVHIKFSEFIQFELLGPDPNIQITYRLVRRGVQHANEEVLESWQFGFQSAKVTEPGNVGTSQPTVLTYTDCLSAGCEEAFVYSLQLTEIQTHRVKSYNIVDKRMIAMVAIRSITLEEGRVYKPVLPTQLTIDEKPITLAEVGCTLAHYEKKYVFINFSGFITSVLNNEAFNELRFQLVRQDDRGEVEVIKIWRFRRAFVEDTIVKEPVIYNVCQCLEGRLSHKYCYLFQLTYAKLSEASYYQLTNKSLTLLSSTIFCQRGKINRTRPYLTCGRVDHQMVTSEMVEPHTPITLASIKINPKGVKEIFLDYSQNLFFNFGGKNPILTMVYGLTKEDTGTGTNETLATWTYEVKEVIGTNVEEVKSIEPLVLQYCDVLEWGVQGILVYKVVLLETITKQTDFVITDKNLGVFLEGNCERY